MRIGVGIGFVGLSGKLNDWDEDRRISQNERERKQEDINNRPPSAPEENEVGESAISTKGNLDIFRNPPGR